MTDSNFWKDLSRPITAMAPMSGVTDVAFRWMVVKYSRYGGDEIGEYGEEKLPEVHSGGPDVIYTEFISADGLFLGDKKELLEDMRYSDVERPIVAQFFSSDPGRMKEAASLARELSFDGVDINLGCPDRSVCKQGAGSELIRSPEVARKVMKAVKEGAGPLPVSVKTRAGYYSDDELEDWLGALLSEKPSALVLHARTRKDMYKEPARWSLVERAVKLRDSLGSDTLILGNGDIASLEDLHQKVKNSGADGAMVGRSLLGTPGFFSGAPSPSPEDRLRTLIEHCKLFERLHGMSRNFAFMKKHFKPYVSGWEQAKELRSALMSADSAEEVESIIKEHGYL